MNQPGHRSRSPPASKVFYRQISWVTHVEPKNHGGAACLLAGVRLKAAPSSSPALVLADEGIRTASRHAKYPLPSSST
jgi:hypothetical protein